MVSVSNINLQYTGATGGQTVGKQVGEIAKQVVSDAIINALISAGGANEINKTGERATKAATDQASSSSNISAQQQIVTNAIQTITQMVQTGQVDIANFQNLLTQVITSITDNNTKAEAMGEQIKALNEENKQILSELESLNNGTLEGLDIETFTETSDTTNNTDSMDGTNNTDRPSSKKTGTNPNQAKIAELLEKLGRNNQMIGALKACIVEISQQQTSYVEQGQSAQQQTEQKHADVVSSVQGFAQQKFSEFTNALGQAISNGVLNQQTHSTEGLANQSSDTSTAAALTAKAASSGFLGAIGAVFTGGLSAAFGGASAANATKEAALFTTAAGMNGANSGKALANKEILKQIGDQLGNTLALNLTEYVNSQLQGAITEMTNAVLGEDIGSKVSPKIMEYLQDQGQEQA